MSNAALYVTDEAHRAALIRHARTNAYSVTSVRDALSPSKAQRAWEALGLDAHSGEFDVVIVDGIASIPGGLFRRLRELRKLSNCGIRIDSINEPWLDLTGDQAQLLDYILTSHQAQTRTRIVQGLDRARANGHQVGRPRVDVDVQAMVEFRATHTLRETARHFKIGASTCWRILQAHRETQRGGGSR